jgi:hypothetical protein
MSARTDDPDYDANITVTGDDGRFPLRKLFPNVLAIVALPGSQRLVAPFDFEDPAWRVPPVQTNTPKAGDVVVVPTA